MRVITVGNKAYGLTDDQYDEFDKRAKYASLYNELRVFQDYLSEIKFDYTDLGEISYTL